MEAQKIIDAIVAKINELDEKHGREVTDLICHKNSRYPSKKTIAELEQKSDVTESALMVLVGLMTDLGLEAEIYK